MLHIQIPNTGIYLCDGNIVRLGRFDEERWVLHHGWFSFGGNRPWCGWYLRSIDSDDKTKPLQLTDLDDIYIIERN